MIQSRISSIYIRAFLLCLDISGLMLKAVIDNLQSLKQLEDLGNFWPHATLRWCLLMRDRGQTTETRDKYTGYITFNTLSPGQYHPDRLQSLRPKVGERTVILEEKMDRDFKRKEIMRHVQRTRGVYTNALLSEATTVCHKAQGASPNSSYQDLASAIVPGAKRVKKPFKQVLEYLQVSNRTPNYIHRL
jgi:hypothetical protein